MNKYSPEAFRNACGDSGPLSLLAEQPKGQSSSFAFLRQPFAIVGRDKVSDVILNDRRVSRRHAYLQILNGSVYCVDLKSKCGIRWHEEARFADWLHPMDPVQLGGCTLRLQSESSSPMPFQPVNPTAAGCLEKSPVKLEFLNGKKSQAEWSVDRVLTLMGTFAGCKIRLHDSKVASVHASLVCTEEGAWIVDLLSATGTYLNGQNVRLARLEDGDALRIGEFEMRVLCGPTAALATRSSSTVSQIGIEHNRTAKSSHATRLELGSVARDFAFESTRHHQRAIEGFVGSSGKAMLESIFLPMVQQQLNIVQNQMLDQFQQAMAMMFQVFCTLQKEQIEAIRVELDRVQGLTREIETLQLELKASVDSRSINGPPLVSVAERNGHSVVVGQPGNSDPLKQQLSSEPCQCTNPIERQPAAGTNGNKAEAHAMLCARMATLEKDRRSRIQKVVDFLSGS